MQPTDTKLRLECAIVLSRLILKLGNTYRITEDRDGKPESDTTHSLMLALIAGEFANEEAIRLDRHAVVSMALIHDLAEAYAGDTSTLHVLSADQQSAKQHRENAALERIRKELAPFPWILDLIDRYERQRCPESQFVRYMDKVMPKLTHRDNGCRVSKASGQTLEAAKIRDAIQIQELQERYPELTMTRDLLAEAAADSYRAWESTP